MFLCHSKRNRVNCLLLFIFCPTICDYSLQDNICTKGLETTAGSKILQGAQQSASCVLIPVLPVILFYPFVPHNHPLVAGID